MTTAKLEKQIKNVVAMNKFLEARLQVLNNDVMKINGALIVAGLIEKPEEPAKAPVEETKDIEKDPELLDPPENGTEELPEELLTEKSEQPDIAKSPNNPF